jgi:hypothetical protein
MTATRLVQSAAAGLVKKKNRWPLINCMRSPLDSFMRTTNGSVRSLYMTKSAIYVVEVVQFNVLYYLKEMFFSRKLNQECEQKV